LLKIRLRRMGAKNRPSYRVVVAEARSPRDGAFVDQIGYYDPLTDPATYKIDIEKAQRWVNNGAQATEAAARLLHRSGVKLRQKVPAEWTGPAATGEA
jgi:small subunit ribosomal protein S16